MMRFEDINSFLGGDMLQLYENLEIKYLSIDSRKSLKSPFTLFFAINGERHDGHKYLSGLAESGVKQFIVERDLDASAYPGCNILKVDSSVYALQTLSGHHRKTFKNPLIAITGSSGKTIVKEWLYQLLAKDHNVYRSPKSYNSQVGVPLSLWHLNNGYELAFIEAGISMPGEMEKLERIINPDIGLFTNLGPAHDIGFASREEKAKEKAKLFKKCRKVIFCSDHELVKKAVLDLNLSEYFTWSSENKEADLTIEFPEGIGRTLRCQFDSHQFEIDLPGNDKATLQNASHCLALLLSLGFSPWEVQKRFRDLTPVSMRLELKKGMNGCYLINDTYNNDLAGLEMALDFLDHQSSGLTKTVILSDILHSGLEDNRLYSQVAELLRKKNIKKFIGIGNSMLGSRELFPDSSQFYASTKELLEKTDVNSFQNEVILVKGARPFSLEKIIDKLQLKIHSTVLEINLDALTHNLNYFRSKLQPGVEIVVMVKAFAYGSGMVEIARWLQYHRVDYLAVAYPDEGVSLRNSGVELPIMVLNSARGSFDKLVAYNLEPEIYSLGFLRELKNFLNGKEEKLKVHLKLDTGMHRLGFMEEDLEELVGLLEQIPNIQVESMFTHLAGQEDPQLEEFTRSQVALFKKMYEFICQGLKYRPKRHVLNSAGITRFPQFHFERVRLGIGLYGVDSDKEVQKHLRHISTFKTIISQIRSVRKGETVGYGRKGLATKDIRVATIPVGYADGYDRRFSNGTGFVLIHGQKAPVIGNVCMDMTMINIEDISAKEGDEVIVFGENHSITELANQIGTIPYEILTNVGERVKRIFLSEEF